MWEEYDTIIYELNTNATGNMIAGFDLAGTLIQSISGDFLIRDIDDWIWTFESIPKFLLSLYKEKWHIVIFSNHKGSRDLPIVREKINIMHQYLIKELDTDVPFDIFISYANNTAKPLTIMYDIFCKIKKCILIFT